MHRTVTAGTRTHHQLARLGIMLALVPMLLVLGCDGVLQGPANMETRWAADRGGVKCGNGKCSGQETCENCPTDCGECPAPEQDMGLLPPDQGSLAPDQGSLAADQGSLAADLGTVVPDTMAPEPDGAVLPPDSSPVVCGDGTCASSESCTSCAADCGSCAGGYQHAGPVFTPTSVWNTPLPASAPIHPDSAKIIAFLKADNVKSGCFMLSGAETNKWGTPIYYAQPGDTAYKVTTVKYSIPPEFAALRIPAGAQPGNNGDAEMVIYDFTAGTVALLSKAAYDAGQDRWTVGGGTIHYLDSNGLAAKVAGGDPRNSSMFRGQNGYMHAVRHAEVAAGKITHVMRIAINTPKAGTWLWPLAGTDGDSQDPYSPPQGARLRLKPSIDLQSYSLHPEARVIAEALQTYGAMVTDSSGAGVDLKLESTVSEGRGQLFTLKFDALCGIPIEDFEVIDYGFQQP